MLSLQAWILLPDIPCTAEGCTESKYPGLLLYLILIITTYSTFRYNRFFEDFMTDHAE